jgi:hypothetical protein
MTTGQRRVWREGVTAGLLGAAGVALWFLVVDMAAGQPLHTPALLGRAMLSVLGHGISNPDLFNAAAYTVFHVLAFVGVGIIASQLVEVSRRIPPMAAGPALFFAVFEVGFYFLAMMISKPEILGALAWYQIGAANLVAAVLMGTYLWRKHPELGPALQHSLDGSV